ncbi:metallophosphoesterase [uncultured Methanofollis sp.]|uniref:metallophosphoesterase n=1 Tax=uncultured Methanofollis sp. TaxID=262500 RepID=UPI00261A41FE|nr:metallophosphoesterase [uncultured Methanofollis sp.]
MFEWVVKAIIQQTEGGSMLIGIMADTHDCLPLVEEAVRVLNEAGVEIILHAGDFVAPFTLAPLSGLKGNLVGVFGNNDGDRALLSKMAAECGNIDLRRGIAEIDVGGLVIGLVHGDNPALLAALLEEGSYDVLVSGHTHHPLIGRYDRTLAINPGEVCGYLTGTPTVALLDTATKETRLVRL